MKRARSCGLFPVILVNGTASLRSASSPNLSSRGRPVVMANPCITASLATRRFDRSSHPFAGLLTGSTRPNVPVAPRPAGGGGAWPCRHGPGTHGGPAPLGAPAGGPGDGAPGREGPGSGRHEQGDQAVEHRERPRVVSSASWRTPAHCRSRRASSARAIVVASVRLSPPVDDWRYVDGDDATLLEHDGRTRGRARRARCSPWRNSPRRRPPRSARVKWAVTVVWAAFNELASEYSASASARTVWACAEVGRISTSWVAASPDAVEPAPLLAVASGPIRIGGRRLLHGGERTLLRRHEFGLHRFGLERRHPGLIDDERRQGSPGRSGCS